MNPYKNNKYHAKPVVIDGIKFDSTKEGKRYQELKLLEKSGAIWDLKLQVKYELIPAQYMYINGKNRCIEKARNYFADFVYTDKRGVHVEDTKGFKTDVYKLKKALMLHVHGIMIEEV